MQSPLSLPVQPPVQRLHTHSEEESSVSAGMVVERGPPITINELVQVNMFGTDFVAI